MSQYVLPVIFTLGLWWLSTGAVLLVVNLRPATYPRSMLLATLVLAGAIYGLEISAVAATVTNVYVAFLCGVLVWGWIEMSYFMGLITGPRPRSCPPGVSFGKRFSLAIQASLYHELAILAFAAMLVALTWSAPNQVGLWTFVILWLMRWSAKLNIFLGVPNINLQFFPDHLRYLETFIVRKRINLLFPVSIALSGAVAALVLNGAMVGTAQPVEITASLLLGSLMLLAILEHGFMVLPLRDAMLWRWAIPARKDQEQPADIDRFDVPAPRDRNDSLHFSNQPLVGFDTVPSCGTTSPRPAITTSGR